MRRDLCALLRRSDAEARHDGDVHKALDLGEPRGEFRRQGRALSRRALDRDGVEEGVLDARRTRPNAVRTRRRRDERHEREADGTQDVQELVALLQRKVHDEDGVRAALELWQKEADADLADANQFHRTGTETDTLNSQEQAIADKIRKGVESVIRFYPVLTCTSTWSRIPRTFMEHLGYVDSPAAPAADETDAPANLASVVSSHSWLKVQDDVSETGDGKWQRTESWMGIPKADGAAGWDADLYGASRWPMPLGGGAAGGGK